MPAHPLSAPTLRALCASSRLRVVAVATLILITGCASAPIYDVVPPEPVDDTTPRDVFRVACPPGLQTRPIGDACAGTIEQVERTIAEPDAAIHPDDPLVIAVGVNQWSSLPVSLPSIPPGLSDPRVIPAIYFTEDGGATWRQEAVPAPMDGIYAGDPTIAFDAAGTLHVGALFWEPDGSGIMYTSTNDLGRSWSTPQALNHDDSTDRYTLGGDRPWLSLGGPGTVYVTWQTPPQSRSYVLRSTDGGATWAHVVPDGIEACMVGTHVRVVDGVPLLACGEYGGGRQAVTRVYALEPSGVGHRVHATLPWPSGTVRMSATDDGTLVLTTPYDDGQRPGARAYRSIDGGASWVGPIDVRAATTLTDDWDWVWLSEAKVGPDGTLHAILVGGPGESCRRQDCDDHVERHRVVYVALDPTTGRRLGEARLTPVDPAGTGRDDGMVDVRPPPVIDDFHSIVFEAGGSFIAWGHDGVVHHARIWGGA